MNLEHLIITSPDGLAIIIPPIGLDNTYQLECTEQLEWVLKKGSLAYELVGQKPDVKPRHSVIICEKEAKYERYHEIRVRHQEDEKSNFSFSL